LLDRLNQHFVCVHAHPNNCCGSFKIAGTELNLPRVHELTFLRRDRWESSGEISCYLPMLPHPLDISFNVRNKPPIFLNEHWLADGKRAPESEIKMLTDQVSYLENTLKQARTLATNQANTELLNLHRLAQNAAKAMPSPIPRTIDATGLIDLAEGKSFLLSSRHSACPTDTHVKTLSPFFFHTGGGINQSITIDLGEQADLFELRISNRTDGCEERARYLYYCLHNDQKADLHKGLPVVMEDSFLDKSHQESLTKLQGIRARYVTIFSPINTFLHFSAVKIFGSRVKIG
jgi:hypothetical protein